MSTRHFRVHPREPSEKSDPSNSGVAEKTHPPSIATFAKVEDDKNGPALRELCARNSLLQTNKRRKMENGAGFEDVFPYFEHGDIVSRCFFEKKLLPPRWQQVGQARQVFEAWNWKSSICEGQMSLGTKGLSSSKALGAASVLVNRRFIEETQRKNSKVEKNTTLALGGTVDVSQYRIFQPVILFCLNNHDETAEEKRGVCLVCTWEKHPFFSCRTISLFGDV